MVVVVIVELLLLITIGIIIVDYYPNFDSINILDGTFIVQVYH